MIDIVIKSRKYNFSLAVNQKVTVIRGESGRGKSMFTRAAEDVSGAYSVKVSDTRYKLVVPPNRFWYETISRNIKYGDKCIYVLDDADYIASPEFAHLFKQDTSSFYIIINRTTDLSLKRLSQIPFSIDEVYELVADGINHSLVHSYAESDMQSQSFDFFMIEDSGSAYDFFSSINSGLVSSSSKDKIISRLPNTCGNLLLIADRAALGNCYDEILEKAYTLNLNIVVPKHYHSFEFFLLRSRMFDFDTTTITNEMICSYSSYERMFEKIIYELTSGKPYHYDKSAINPCFTVSCCCKRSETKICDKGFVAGDKIEQLFSNTGFELLISCLKPTKTHLFK